MIAPPLPRDEAKRLSALRDLLILDTPPEQRFDRIVAFAADEFDVSMASVTLVDENRQWFKAKVGLNLCETPRETSFCGHAILAPVTLVIPDAALDPRFAQNPLVVGEPFIRFYAGAPLHLPGGEIVGTLCLMDQRPRVLDRVGLAILESLCALVLEELMGREALS